MSDWLMRVINAEAGRLVELAAEDDELRADLRALAESILAATESHSNADEFVAPGTDTLDGAQTQAQRARRMNRSGNSGWDDQRRRNAIPGRTRRRCSSPRPRLTNSSTLKTGAGGKARQLTGRLSGCAGLVRETIV